MKHSRTSSASSYKRDFSELIEAYTEGKRNRVQFGILNNESSRDHLHPCEDQGSDAEHPVSDYSSVSSSSDEHSVDDNGFLSSSDQMTVEFLEDDLDLAAFDNLDGIASSYFNNFLSFTLHHKNEKEFFCGNHENLINN